MNLIKYLGYLFSTYAKFSEKVISFTLRYTYVCVRIKSSLRYTYVCVRIKSTERQFVGAFYLFTTGMISCVVIQVNEGRIEQVS